AVERNSEFSQHVGIRRFHPDGEPQVDQRAPDVVVAKRLPRIENETCDFRVGRRKRSCSSVAVDGFGGITEKHQHTAREHSATHRSKRFLYFEFNGPHSSRARPRFRRQSKGCHPSPPLAPQGSRRQSASRYPCRTFHQLRKTLSQSPHIHPSA